MGIIYSRRKTIKDVKIYASKFSSTSSTTQKNSILNINSDKISRPETPTSYQNHVITSFDSILSRDSDIDSQINYQSNSFFLPKDWDSREHHYNLHFVLKTLFAGNTTPAVAPKLQKGALVIQLGTCTGPWIMDMATHYPRCQFIGIELVRSLTQGVPLLPNVTFILGNLENGFDIADSSVSYIHLRSMGTFLTTDKWPKLLKEFRRILKPDGLIRIEEIHHSPSGTVMIESFFEALRTILIGMNIDYDIALKYGHILTSNGFELVETKKRGVHYASNGKLSEEVVSTILNSFYDLSDVLAPKMGLDVEDFRHRVEMICSQCVRIDAKMEWYSWVAKMSSL
ncbi:S-adenosyl-L-methionine-dependent methyltransferase [Pilobolus umbonatus]|nr:S-adenosyl-L-methionine-dependent methyltransferase [Pilobolus umbonatus]